MGRAGWLLLNYNFKLAHSRWRETKPLVSSNGDGTQARAAGLKLCEYFRS